MDIAGIQKKIKKYKSEGKRLFATSSFQTNSVVLLHVLSRVDKDIPVYFINTGYHFPETIKYKDTVTKLLGLRVIDLLPHVPKVMQCNAAGDLLFTYDPDYCCYLNKVQPIEALMEQYDIWVNGVRAGQNSVRKNFREEEPAKYDTLRYHPLLQWTDYDMDVYIHLHELPLHPLEKHGYKSIGCEPCTRPASGDSLRGGRWAGMKKTECGLHLNND
jgi:phosphoadenosine phosphosulfate reductase